MRIETSPEDIHGMHAAEGILDHARRHDQPRGGRGARHGQALRVRRRLAARRLPRWHARWRWARPSAKGDIITIDGGTGQVLQGRRADAAAGACPAISPRSWNGPTAIRRMKVRTNAETPADARMARSFGAEGIGLCRTEHMFFDGDRIVAMREMILADNERRAASGACQAAADAALGLPRTVRDHGRAAGHASGCSIRRCTSSCPKSDEEIDEVAAAMNVSADKLRRAHRSAARVQPDARPPRLPPGDLLSRDRRDAGARHLRSGGRGWPRSTGRPVVPEIMVPLVGLKTELDFVKRPHRCGGEQRDGGNRREDRLSHRHHDRAAARGHPRACASRRRPNSSPSAPTTSRRPAFGISRDDAARFLETYRQKGIVEQDPFVTLDIDGVGELVKMAAEKGRATRPGHQARHMRRAWRRPGLDPFLPEVGLDYVSCSPYRVPIARLAAAQAAVAKAG